MHLLFCPLTDGEHKIKTMDRMDRMVSKFLGFIAYMVYSKILKYEITIILYLITMFPHLMNTPGIHDDRAGIAMMRMSTRIRVRMKGIQYLRVSS